jgi:hypothetical protein
MPRSPALATQSIILTPNRRKKRMIECRASRPCAAFRNVHVSTVCLCQSTCYGTLFPSTSALVPHKGSARIAVQNATGNGGQGQTGGEEWSCSVFPFLNITDESFVLYLTTLRQLKCKAKHIRCGMHIVIIERQQKLEDVKQCKDIHLHGPGWQWTDDAQREILNGTWADRQCHHENDIWSTCETCPFFSISGMEADEFARLISMNENTKTT